MNVREKVARAICREHYETRQHPVAVDHYVDACWREHIAEADAALEASGYHRMREALANLVRLNDAASFTDSEPWMVEWVEANRVARAALGEDKP